MADITQLEILLENRDFEGARNMITSIVDEKISEGEKGEVLVDFASAYMQVMNSINERYKTVLEEAIKSMQIIKKSESRTGDHIRIGEVRASLRK